MINAFAIGIYGVTIAFLCLTGSIEALGANIPQPDLLSDYTIGVIWSLMLGLSISFWPVRSRDKVAFLTIWIVKSFITLGIMLFYEANYSFLDAYSYFNVPMQYDFEWAGLNIGQGTENIYSIVWLYYKIMPASYHALKVSFALVGLIAIYLIYRATVLFLQKEDIRILYVLALFPSILFWSSIIGKDPFTLLGIALYVYGVIGWYRFRKLRFIWMLALGVVITIFIRVWLGPILIAPIMIIPLFSVRGILPKLMMITLTTGTLVFMSAQLLNHFNVEAAQDVLTILDTVSRSWSEDGGSGQTIQADFTQIHQALAFIPLGMFTALFRPLPGEVLNPFGLLAGLENLILLLLLLRAAIRTKLHDLKNPVVMWASLFVLTWAIVYGFISYQNLGTAVRFRLQILPVLLCLLLYLGRQRKFAKKLLYYRVVNEYGISSPR
ncbi:MAG: hypothetical protein M1443_02670 [Nitrospirae bacterium]|nr:hypothetical protein [Nitrospirota bacterium]